MLRDVGAELPSDTDLEDALAFLEGYYGLPNFDAAPVPESVETAASRRARTVRERVSRIRGAAWAAKGRNHASV